MSVYKRIFAISLLIIFAIVTFHDLLPHAHHAHDAAEGQSEHHEDHHKHDNDGILAALGHVLHLHNHSHSDCEIDVCPEIPMVKRDTKDNYKSSKAVLTDPNDEPVNQTVESIDNDLSTYYLNSLLQGISTRGPPSDGC